MTCKDAKVRAHMACWCVEHGREITGCVWERAEALKAQRRALKDDVRDLRGFIRETFYGNVPIGRRSAPNSWYKDTSKTYGQALDEIMRRGDDIPDE